MERRGGKRQKRKGQEQLTKGVAAWMWEQGEGRHVDDPERPV